MSLTAVRYDKQTHMFDPQEEKFWLHYLSRDSKDRMVRDYIRSQITKNPNLRKEILQQPVCIKCEGFTFFHKGGAQCVACGHWTPDNQTHSVKEHMRGGYYR
ncbi:hypothetical protein PN4B1_16960 [Paenibacillus naphthalenovorans]|uniref:hypothetical protein n=1 Tax=Paenibacillus naphthalenovorans TaxID=162209 RepID=UPI0010B17DAB|nr:hypothetical protein [Paenibacillus naphthalenovorans]GCL71791.1 hypothetical protein PN4B1_16960 [Paenibacillus naphthalenovorans]